MSIMMLLLLNSFFVLMKVFSEEKRAQSIHGDWMRIVSANWLRELVRSLALSKVDFAQFLLPPLGSRKS